MGWDLLSGKTKLRKKLMQLLWTTKSQVLQLEESFQSGNSHEVIFFIFFLKPSYRLHYGCYYFIHTIRCRNLIATCDWNWQVSCVEHLCDFLCYQLDLATFVACVNSGQSWSLKSSLLLSRRELPRCEVEDYDPFVENLVLERLSVGSPIRVPLYICICSWLMFLWCSCCYCFVGMLLQLLLYPFKVLLLN